MTMSSAGEENGRGNLKKRGQQIPEQRNVPTRSLLFVLFQATVESPHSSYRDLSKMYIRWPHFPVENTPFHITFPPARSAVATTLLSGLFLQHTSSAPPQGLCTCRTPAETPFSPNFLRPASPHRADTTSAARTSQPPRNVLLIHTHHPRSLDSLIF